jgi:shikimate kinase
MGSGKTTIGKKLAKRLGLQFIDLDIFIEKKTKKTIQTLFETKGEDNFRRLEYEALSEISKTQNILVATGGGTACFLNNIELINENGLSIYLKMNPESLANRLNNSKTERPLIKGKSKSELLTYIKDTLDKREKYYKKSNIVVSGLNPDIDNITKIINDFTA